MPAKTSTKKCTSTDGQRRWNGAKPELRQEPETNYDKTRRQMGEGTSNAPMMSIQETVVDIFACVLARDTEDVTLTARPIEDLGADSLDLQEVIMTIEDDMELAIAEDLDPQKFETVADWVRMIEKVAAK